MGLTRRAFLAHALRAAALAPLPTLSLAKNAQPLPKATQLLLTKKIPSSGEPLPVIGLGTARRYESASSEAELAPLRDTLREFRALGGSVIDTAPTYGDAEAVVGELIEGLGIRDRLFLATKVSTTGREAGVAQIEQSFRDLRTASIDLIAVHNLRDTETHLRTLRDLKQQGRIR